MLRISRFLLTLALALTLAAARAGAQVNVTTQHNDNARTGANLNETTLTTQNVNVNQFGKLFSRDVDGQLYAQPLYVSNVTLPDGTTHNLVYAATQNNSVYAFDADDPDPDAGPLWQVNLGHAAVTPTGDFATVKFVPYHDMFPEVGITGTPVIDLSTNTMYVVAHTRELSGEGTYQYHHVLHALDITTGQDTLGGPVEISGAVRGDGDGSVGGMIAFDSLNHLQRPALLLSNGVVFIAFGSYADNDPSHGWVFAYDAATLNQRAIFNTTPNAPGGEGTIWQSNQGLLADAQGNVYFTTGNSRCDSSPGPCYPIYVRDEPVPGNYTESVVKLTMGDGGLTVADWFTPCNQCNLDRSDSDLGSAGPLLVPGTNLLLAVGKNARAYVLDTNNLGHLVNAPPSCGSTCNDDQIVQRINGFANFNYSSPIFWDGPNGPTVYVWGNNDRLKAYQLEDGLFHTTPDSQSGISAPWGGGGLSLSADGNTAGTGIVWGSFPPGGSSNPITQMGQLRAFDASDLANDVWNSDQNPAFDSLGILAKYNLPTIANGKVYMPSSSGQLHVFGLLPDNPPPLIRLTAPTALSVLVGPADVTLTATALSRDGSPVTSVDFYADGQLIGTATDGPPYSVVWSAATLGMHVLSAVATSPNGATARSKSVTFTLVADAPSHGPIISINLAGTTTPMGADEVAGVADLDLARPNWNNAISEDNSHARKEGWLNINTLVDDSGTDTLARLSWTANGANSLFILNNPGDFRMMRGYLDTSNTTSTNVTVSDLPASFIANGYDVVVYFDGDNPTESRTAAYRIGSTMVSGTDAAGVDFSGTYCQAIAGSAGNYVVIPGVSGDRFTLEATTSVSSGSTKRAPMNGIQLVARTPMP
jgi:hypothetical protein